MRAQTYSYFPVFPEANPTQKALRNREKLPNIAADMNHPSFDITAVGEDPSLIRNGHCLLEWSNSCFTVLWFGKAPFRFYRLLQYSLKAEKELSHAEQLRDILAEESAFREPVLSTTLVYNTGNAQLLPDSVSIDALQQPLMDYLSGTDTSRFTLAEKPDGLQAATVYRISREIQELFETNFPGAGRWHYYSLTQKQLADNPKPGIVYSLNCCPDKFMLAVTVDSELYLIQDLYYEQPEDISWFLLSFTEQSGFSRDAVQVVVGGLIESSSVLYQELEKYFLNLELQQFPEEFDGEPALEAYPSHYFSPLLKLALCV